MMKMDPKFLLSCLVAGSIFALPAMAADDEQAQLNGRSEVSIALADNGGEHHEWREHEHLSTEQLEKMSSLKNEFEQKTIMQKAQLHVFHLQMEELMLKPSVDRGALQAIQSKINSLHDELSTRFLNYKLDKMEILTPTQREEMRHRMLMHSVFGDGHHHGGGHGHWGQGGHEGWHGGEHHGPGGPKGEHKEG